MILKCFHSIKVTKKIINIWKRINANSGNKLGVVRDFDDQQNAKEEYDKMQNDNIIICTTHGYTLETDITNLNYELIKDKYGADFGWSNMTKDELQKDWRKDGKKSGVMLRICHDLVHGKLHGFVLPTHIQKVINFMQGDYNAS